ncbi:MAG: hypothetical protein A2Y71_09365 [Bacteroidetes bacterium RBG_13_42_15]|nr:MAG: hypothetical protein A2Y71_09365 [Bacteroidetes bacterium RBG_13_42_15]
MSFSLKAIFYRSLIDPVLFWLRNEIIACAGRPEKVINIACGTGTLAIALAQNANHVTGIDLDEDLVSYASQKAEQKGLKNLNIGISSLFFKKMHIKHT